MDITTAELHGRIQALEFLLTQLLFEGLQDGDRKLFVAKMLQNYEQQLHDQIPGLDDSTKGVARHALQSLKEIIASLTLNLTKRGQQIM